MNLKRFASIGADIWIGSADMCPERYTAFEHKIHIHSPGQVSPCTHAAPSDLSLQFVEKIPLGSERIQAIHRVAVLPGRLFIHCGAGMCRSPTAAIVALVARGYTPGQAMGAIADAMWRQYADRITPWWEHAVMQEIFNSPSAL